MASRERFEALVDLIEAFADAGFALFQAFVDPLLESLKSFIRSLTQRIEALIGSAELSLDFRRVGLDVTHVSAQFRHLYRQIEIDSLISRHVRTPC
jgi:hypothetical protein